MLIVWVRQWDNKGDLTGYWVAGHDPLVKKILDFLIKLLKNSLLTLIV